MSDEGPKTMAVSGASGLVGSALVGRGWSVIPLVRDRREEGVYWSIEEKKVESEKLEGVDAVVHLAGAPIAGGRWTRRRREAIRDSRLEGTRLVAEAVESLGDPPSTFVCASGVNVYGQGFDEWVDESSQPREGFLADVCRGWEAACEPARRVSRVINTRFGVVLSSRGGALKKMLTPFKLGLGGRIGDGSQHLSWVALQDAVRAVLFLIEETGLEGPVNVVSPNPVTNAEFTEMLGEALERPTPLPIPAALLKLAVGSKMAEETLLNGQRARPKRLLEEGFRFEYPQLPEALEAALQ